MTFLEFEVDVITHVDDVEGSWIENKCHML